MNNQDPRFLRLKPILDSQAQEIIIIFGRGSGKSYSTKYWILERIEQQKKEFIWLRRQFDSIRTGSLESWKRVIANYCQDNQVPEKDIELVWDAITRGIKYEGVMKCFMVELFSSYKARENYTQTISHIIFDEAIINPKTGEKYLEDEKDKIDELLGSAWRDRENDPKPQLIYIANPYERFRPFMREFLPLIRKDREKLKKRVLANELVNLKINNKEIYLFKNTSCQKFCNCELENCLELWGNFFAREEDLKITEFINGSLPKYIFQDCIFYQAKKGFYFFAHRENKEISNKEDLKFVPEYYTNNQQRLKCQAYQIFIEENYLREDLHWIWQQNLLRFCPDGSREIILEFMEKGKIKIS